MSRREGRAPVLQERGLGLGFRVPTPGTPILKPFLWATESCNVKVSPSLK